MVLSISEYQKERTRTANAVMSFEREDFGLLGPLHLNSIDWANSNHRRSIAASLVQGTYILERDRQEKRQGSQALAPPWWEFFHFKLIRQLVDDVDSCVFGAIYEYAPPSSHCNDSIDRSPRYVIAFRAVRNMVAMVGDSSVWLAGHSLGAAMAMLAGKTIAKTGNFLEAFLFNPPFLSAPIERINYGNVKHGLRFASSFITAGLVLATKDHLCSEYIGYFEHRKKMEEIRYGAIERLATQNSLGDLFMSVVRRSAEAAEPLHLLPSAYLTVNLTPSEDFKQAHGIQQWWRPDLHLKCNLYKYK
ncbi:hypothetical protein GOBAR_DD18366 [Gossypium barbadense]|nr:hypothetical protein GOBAR_DD18366 [Gossypium barbadense]